jgi:PIN domain nuclease of toxin-antitoxin system
VPFEESGNAGVDKVVGGAAVSGVKVNETATGEIGEKKPHADANAPAQKVLRKSDYEEGVRVGEVMVRLGDQRLKAAGPTPQLQGEVEVKEQYPGLYVRSYKTDPEDVGWAQCGVVATIASGEVVSVVRRRLQDAGFKELDLIHLGGDRVFVRGLAGVDVLAVLNGAKDFFKLCFSNWVRWEKEVIPYRRGAWVRLYGIPLHAWNVLFFKLCVMDCGRFLRTDNYTADKERLDFARVLIATHDLAVIKKVEQLLVDGSLVNIQIIEEWGFDLGDDACLLEDEVGSKASVAVEDECWEDSEGSNHVDMLVDNMAKGVVDEQGAQEVVIEPDPRSPVTDASVDCVAETEVKVSPTVNGRWKLIEMPRSLELPQPAVQSAPIPRKRTTSCPPVRRHGLSGPWSLEWIQDQSVKDAGAVKQRLKKGCDVAGDIRSRAARGPLLKQDGGFIRNSLCSLKRIARLPLQDRREVMHILQKNARRRKNRRVASHSSNTGSRDSVEGTTSSSSVNNDWKNWVAMQGNERAVEDDVLEVGNAVGATFKGDKANMFSVLSKAGPGKCGTSGVAPDGVASKEWGG